MIEETGTTEVYLMREHVPEKCIIVQLEKAIEHNKKEFLVESKCLYQIKI